MLPVTAFFAGMLALLYIALSVRVIVRRYAAKVALGDGGDSGMARRIRAHANFAEYVPLALVLLAVAELNEVSRDFLGAVGWLLLAGRVSHAFSILYYEPKRHRIIFRQAGMAMTFTAIVLLALNLLF